jgi:hypothetical protein
MPRMQGIPTWLQQTSCVEALLAGYGLFIPIVKVSRTCRRNPSGRALEVHP